MPGQPRSDFAFDASEDFPDWLREIGGSLGFTTYQIGKLFMVGLQPNGRLSVYERTLERCMGLAATATGFHVATAYQIWRFENLLPPGGAHDGHDALYAPRLCWVTGDIDVHDVATGGDGRPVFASTLFGCIATVSDTDSFRPLWRPPFLSALAAEDRCHLNGLAMRDGAPFAVTAASRSDVADRWRDHRADGGVVLAVPSGEVLADGLSMPHSPRWHRDRLWLHNSGTGEFGYVDPARGRFEPVAFCPGYLRGLAFTGRYAVAGLSLPRYRTFAGLPLDDRLTRTRAKPRAGLLVIDLDRGAIVHTLGIESFASEIYDVAVFPGPVRPKLLGFQTDEIRTYISVETDRRPAQPATR